MSQCAKTLAVALLCSVWLGAAAGGAARKPAPTPASVFGFEPGADRRISDTTQIARYFRELAAAAPDRMVLTEIGKSVEGRPIQLAIISSEENIRRLPRLKEISHRLATDTSLTDEDANQLIREGKAVIFIDHGKDGNEPASAEAAAPLAYHLVSSEDPDVRLIRENAVVLIIPCINPDGRERTLTWYRRILGTEFEMTGREPWLDHPYNGHEGNRDLNFLVTPELQALAKMNWHEWNPQIVVDQHQGVPYPARIFVPPFQEPLNPDISPLVQRGINLVGSAMALRFEQAGLPGVISRATYTAWGNYAVRDSGNYHNQIGILVETQQRPARWASPGFTPPESIPSSFGIPTAGPGLVPDAPSVFYPNPWKGGAWRYRDQVQYVMTASMGAADIAARLKDHWLRNMYQLNKENTRTGRQGNPFAYVIPPDQWDGSESVELVNALQRLAVQMHKATAPFTAGGRQYPAGSYIAFAGQPFRYELLDLMEPQRHPDLRGYPGGPPIRPYDQAAWTLPIGTGVRVDRIDKPFDVQVSPQTTPIVRQGRVTGNGPTFLMSTRENASFKALNQLWSAGLAVSRSVATFDAGGQTWPAGTFVVRGDAAELTSIAASAGVEFVGVGEVPAKTAKIVRPKVGIYQSYVVVDHNPDEGWVRWVLERYGYEYKTLKNQDLRTGDLSAFSAIILPDQDAATMLRGFAPGTNFPEYVGGIGADGAANLKRFAEAGGTIIALNEASSFAMTQLGLPVENAAENLPPTTFFVAGSFLRTKFDTTHPLAFGMPSEAGVMYYRRGGATQLALEIIRPASANDKQAHQSVSVAARFGDKPILMSGWQVGADQYLAGTPAVVQAAVGEGSAILINFRPHFRDQARGTFKILFNSILAASTEKAGRTSVTQ